MSALFATIINAVMSFVQCTVMGVFIIAAIVKVIDRAIPLTMWLNGMFESMSFVFTTVCTLF